MAVVRPPAAAAHLLVFSPSVECSEREVIEDHPLAGAHKRFERSVRAISPAILLAAVVVIDDDQVVGRERLGPERLGTPR